FAVRAGTQWWPLRAADHVRGRGHGQRDHHRASPMSITADLSGSVAVVTGASSGIGRHFCTLLADSGAVVVAAARRAERLAKLQRADGRIVPKTCDVTSSADNERVIERDVARGGPHTLGNAVAFGDAVPARRRWREDFGRTLERDLTGTLEMSAFAARPMGKAGGSILNIGSVLGLCGSWPGTQAASCAPKGGVV